MIFSEMYRCFYGRSRKYYTIMAFGLDSLHFVFFWTTKLLPNVCEDFVHLSDTVWRYGQIKRDQNFSQQVSRARLRVIDLRFRASLDFAPTRSSSPPCFRSCNCLFDMARGSLIWLKWLQENVELFIMLNKQRRWLHSSRVKLPSVILSASWVFSIYIVDLDFRGFKLILSNSQSCATLLVRDSCLLVGVLPFIIIMITASLC